MKDWIEVRVRGRVDGHDFDRTMTGDGAVVHSAADVAPIESGKKF